MTMTTSPAGRAFIESFEALRLQAYLPTGHDVWTVGWGHTHGVREGDVCTEAQADGYLAEDLKVAELAVDCNVGVELSQNQYDACVSLAFNIQAPFTQRPYSRLLTKLNAGDMQGAADEFLAWDHQAGAVLAGLTRRRQAERELFLQAASVTPA